MSNINTRNIFIVSASQMLRYAAFLKLQLPEWGFDYLSEQDKTFEGVTLSST